MKKIILITLWAMNFGSGGVAEPSPMIESLVLEPASVFDVGMLRLELFTGPNSFVEYDWDSDLITISVFKSDFLGDVGEAQGVCSAWISDMRSRAQIGSLPKHQNSRFSDFFLHKHFQLVEGRPDFRSDLDGRFQLQVTIVFDWGGDEIQSLRCMTPLIGNGYSVTTIGIY